MFPSYHSSLEYVSRHKKETESFKHPVTDIYIRSVSYNYISFVNQILNQVTYFFAHKKLF